MSPTVQELERSILKLESADRTRLVERLLASLDAPGDVERAWVEEAEQRRERQESTPETLVSVDAALARIRARLA